jgi:hypothetical protein
VNGEAITEAIEKILWFEVNPISNPGLEGYMKNDYKGEKSGTYFLPVDR